MIDFSGYESPIELIQDEIKMQMEENICRAVQKTGIDVRKEELLKALEYDRGQFEKGFERGYRKAVDDFVERLKDYFVIPHDLMVIEQYAKQLKDGDGK